MANRQNRNQTSSDQPGESVIQVPPVVLSEQEVQVVLSDEVIGAAFRWYATYGDILLDGESINGLTRSSRVVKYKAPDSSHSDDQISVVVYSSDGIAKKSIEKRINLGQKVSKTHNSRYWGYKQFIKEHPVVAGPLIAAVATGLFLLVNTFFKHRLDSSTTKNNIIAPTPTINTDTEAVASITESQASTIVDEYIRAWRNKNLDGRMIYLPQDFTSSTYDICKKNQEDPFIPYSKTKNLEQYKRIALENIANPDPIIVEKLSPFAIAFDKAGVSVEYRQKYKQSGYQSTGLNKFHLRRNNNNKIEIYKEIFYRETCSSCQRKC